MDVWSKEDDSVFERIEATLEKHPHYNRDMSHRQLNGLRRKIKSELYEALPPEEKDRWEKAAEEWQPADLSEYVDNHC
jgi:hypothetical protein